MVAGASFKAVSEFIKAENLQGLKIFLDSRHANLEDKDEDGRTPLIFAASLGRLDFIPLLLSHNADLNAEDNDKATALHWAAREGFSEVCLELLEQGSAVEAQDSGQWTPLLWACYRGHVRTAECLLRKGANINAKGVYQVSSLVWAAGRGHLNVVQLLIDNNIKVDIGDKYGTTALIWACRKGHEEIVEVLLRAGSSVDAVGMYSWTPLLVATRGNFTSVVEKLLEKSPNINTVDKDGLTALAIACKEGFTEIAFMLLAAGAYTNLQDRSGETNLIYACKGGHKAIVEALIKKYADVDVKGKDGKSCLHWAIDKNHASIVKIILSANPDLEGKTAEGDTPLLRAVRQRNLHVVEMLLEKKVKITATDNKGDTALHIAMRARSKGIVELLLRNPKHSQLLYKPNKQGETPYNIDASSQNTILGQIFGARKINSNDNGETILGYDLYSSALADILTEPGLTMPITVGLYAKWGSGKSFLLGKLKNEMMAFTQEWVIEPAFKNTVLLFLVVLHIACLAGLLGWLIPYSAFNLYDSSIFIGIGISSFVFVISYVFLVILWKGTLYYDFYSLFAIKTFLAAKFHALKLVLNVIFSNPPGTDTLDGSDETGLHQRATPLKLLFTDKTKVVTSAGGQNSVTQMLGSLFEAVEEQYGSCATRLYRAFKPKPLHHSSRVTWRRLCCIPYVIIYLTCFTCVAACIALVAMTVEYSGKRRSSSLERPSNPPYLAALNSTETSFDNADHTISEEVIFGLLLTLSVLVGAALLANIYTIGNCIISLTYSQRKHLQRAMSRLDVVKSEGYLQALKNEVQLLVDMVNCLDAFTGQKTRLVVIVDGLDSCEQSKVLSVLDAVHMLFSDEGSPFIILFAIDPHVITKAIELNIHQVYRDTSISGDAYLRNLVHMPFFLQNVSLRRVNIAQQIAGMPLIGLNKRNSTLWLETDDRRMSTESSATRKKVGGSKHSKSFFRRQRHDSLGSSVGSRLNHVGTNAFGGMGDLAMISLTDDYFSDVNIKSVRRFMNVIYVMGRLMKAFNIDFSWYHLGVWVNISEQWPYRLSWLIFFFEMNEDSLDDSTSLKDIYEKVQAVMPTQKELEPLLEMDRDEKKLDALLSLKKRMTVRDMKTFLPFSINLDPYIKKVIKDEYSANEENSNNYGVHGHSGMLSSRQAAGLSRKISGQDPNAQPGPLQGVPHNLNQYPPYNFGMPVQMTPWSNHHPPQSGFVFENMISSAHHHEEIIELTPEMTMKPLSKKSIEDVCSLIMSVEGLSSAQIETYCKVITSQNISGSVLSHCKIEELKSVLNMSFGDWELFQLIIYGLRERERKLKTEQRIMSIHVPGSIRTSQRSSPERKRQVGVLAEVSSSGQQPSTPQPSVQLPKSSSSSKIVSTHESQVTFEDAMISTLLSTLNEEAQEDVLNEQFDLVVNGSSENVSVSQSLENLPKSVDALSPSSVSTQPSAISRDVEKGLRSSMSKKSHSVITAAIGGGGGLGTLSGWDFGSQSDIGMLSIPTSPTSSTHSPMVSKHSTKMKSDGDSKRKPRHLRDRLDSFSDEDRGGALGRTMSRSTVSGNGDIIASVEDEHVGPYSWISQTAPASPLACRSRSGSIVHEDDGSFFTTDLSKLYQKKLNRKGTSTTYNSKESIYSVSDQTPATSVDKLTDKVKKKIRHALLAMDHHHSGVPAFQRAKPSGSSLRSHFQVSDSESKSRTKIFARAQSLNPADNSQLLTNPGSVFCEMEEDETGDEPESICSSPEQETVAKRPESSSRGPPIHQIFSSLREEQLEGSSRSEGSELKFGDNKDLRL